jgi:uncharacterized protein (TIGR00251 family)
MNADEILKHVVNGKLAVLATPNAKKTEVLGWDEARQALRVAIAAPPEKSRANIGLVKFLSKLLGKRAELVAGAAGRKKILRLN